VKERRFGAIEEILESNGLDVEDASLIVRGNRGRRQGTVFINNQPRRLVLKQIAPHLAVIHAQNESIVHFDAAARQALLDASRGD